MARDGPIIAKPMPRIPSNGRGVTGKVRRIVVIGNAGGGKSTLARELAMIMALPYRAMDDIQWAPGWRPIASSRLNAAHAAWLNDPEWVIDGLGPWDLVIRRLALADAVIHVAHPFWRHVWWVCKRQGRAYVGTPPVTPAGCDFRGMFWPMVRMMWGIHRDRPRIVEAIEREAARGSKVFHLPGPTAIKRCIRHFREETAWRSQQPSTAR